MKPRGWFAALFAAGMLCMAMFLVRQPAGAQKNVNPPWNLILISIDTLRADHLGAYGYHSVTPNLDRLAREGVVFEQVFTSVPLTLPAHASLLTSTYPPVNGIRDNGETLPSSIPTMAEQMRAHGFETAAFISSFVLDRRFGLARGFDEYWGDFPLYRFSGADPGTIQIRGDGVEEAAAKWISNRGASRFFAFVHFYDLHGPFLLPASWRVRFPGRTYDGELAYVDSLIQQFWEGLIHQGVADHTLLVITADHGEGLGDHGELNHGFLLYGSTTRVPLIIRFPNRRFAGKRVETVVRLIDVAPTVCALLEIPPSPSFQGRSLGPEINGQVRAALPAYSETLYPYRQFHSAPLYALRSNPFTFVQAPHPELYDFRKDPAESHNLIHTNQAMANDLREELDKLAGSMAHGPAGASVSPEVLEELKSLGYVGTASPHDAPPLADPSLPDPKDRISLYRQLQEARELEAHGETRAAAARLEEIAAQDPALVIVQIEAGLARQKLQQYDLAARHFRAALQADPENATAHFDLGIALGNQGHLPEAAHEFQLATKLQPSYSRAYAALGSTQAQMGDIPAAIGSLNAALAIDPGDLDALLNRGNLYLELREWEKSGRDLRRAVALEPENAEAHHALGTMEFYKGDLDGALKEYRCALQLAPRSSSLHSDLGLLYRKMGRNADAFAEFRRALALNPNDPVALEALQHDHAIQK
jgi:arylsulfatase A-like enzyme/tetratricopeptide (TPR) repeat protein